MSGVRRVVERGSVISCGGGGDGVYISRFERWGGEE
jgi:hypothetical protein